MKLEKQSMWKLQFSLTVGGQGAMVETYFLATDWEEATSMMHEVALSTLASSTSLDPKEGIKSGETITDPDIVGLSQAASIWVPTKDDSTKELTPEEKAYLDDQLRKALTESKKDA